MVNFAAGFSGNHVNPNLFMPDLRAAIIDIFTNSGVPWDSFVRQFTLNTTTLSHTPVIYIELDPDGRAYGRQVVLSIPQVRPWGFLPVCNNPACDARVGDIKGKASRRHGWAGYHGNFRLRCNVCRFSCTVARPDWIQHIGPDTGFNFVMPWPLTNQQRNTALGLDQTWKQSVEEVGVDVGAGGGSAVGQQNASSEGSIVKGKRTGARRKRKPGHR